MAAEPSLKQLSRSSLAFEPQIGPALTDPAAPAAITRRRTRIAAWANQVVDMGLLTQTAEPPDGRQLGSRQTPPSCARPCEHRTILAGPGFDGIGSRPKMLVFASSAFPPDGQNLAA